MIGSMAARWLLTAVFAAAALWCGTESWAGLPRRGPAGPVQRADLAAAVFCVVMCAALLAMTWLPESAAVVWVQAAGFGCAGVWLMLASRGSSGRSRLPSLAGLHHALMAAAMIWMLTALPGAAGMPPPGHGHGAMTAMPGTAVLPLPVLAISGLIAACCAAASVPWLARAIGQGGRVTGPAAAGYAVMSAGMAAMLIAML